MVFPQITSKIKVKVVIDIKSLYHADFSASSTIIIAFDVVQFKGSKAWTSGAVSYIYKGRLIDAFGHGRMKLFESRIARYARCLRLQP